MQNSYSKDGKTGVDKLLAAASLLRGQRDVRAMILFDCDPWISEKHASGDTARSAAADWLEQLVQRLAKDGGDGLLAQLSAPA